MKKNYRVIFLLLFLLISSQAFADSQEFFRKVFASGGVFLTSLIAVFGYLGKSFYELYMDRRKKQTQNIEDRLKYFYWPFLIRLQKDNYIWETILSKKADNNSMQYRIADQVEKNDILKGHEEMLQIIDNYLYLSEPDQSLTSAIEKYVKHATLYRALRGAGEEKIFPFDLGAPFPTELYPIIKKNTDYYQMKLNRQTL
jgi:hypothetical protein